MNSANGFFNDFSAYFGISFKPDWDMILDSSNVLVPLNTTSVRQHGPRQHGPHGWTRYREYLENTWRKSFDWARLKGWKVELARYMSRHKTANGIQSIHVFPCLWYPYRHLFPCRCHLGTPTHCTDWSDWAHAADGIFQGLLDFFANSAASRVPRVPRVPFSCPMMSNDVQWCPMMSNDVQGICCVWAFLFAACSLLCLVNHFCMVLDSTWSGPSLRYCMLLLHYRETKTVSKLHLLVEMWAMHKQQRYHRCQAKHVLSQCFTSLSRFLRISQRSLSGFLRVSFRLCPAHLAGVKQFLALSDFGSRRKPAQATQSKLQHGRHMSPSHKHADIPYLHTITTYHHNHQHHQSPPISAAASVAFTFCTPRVLSSWEPFCTCSCSHRSTPNVGKMVDRNFDLPGPKWAYSEMDTLPTTFKVPTYHHISLHIISLHLLNCISLSTRSPQFLYSFSAKVSPCWDLSGLWVMQLQSARRTAPSKQLGDWTGELGHQTIKTSTVLKRSGRSEQEKYGKKKVEKPWIWNLRQRYPSKVPNSCGNTMFSKFQDMCHQFNEDEWCKKPLTNLKCIQILQYLSDLSGWVVAQFLTPPPRWIHVVLLSLHWWELTQPCHAATCLTWSPKVVFITWTCRNSKNSQHLRSVKNPLLHPYDT